MIRKSLVLGSVIAGLAVSGCSSVSQVKPSDLRDELTMPLSASNPSPSGSQSSKVVIFDVNASESPAAEQAGAAGPIRFALDGYITEAGATSVDRALAEQLKDEVVRAEMGGAGAYQGAPVADFAIRTNVTQASFGSSFQESSTSRDNKGRVYTNPAKCNFSGRVAITVDVYAVPALERVRSFRGEGTATGSEDARSSNCAADGTNFLRRAGEDAVYDIQEELKAFFAPTGYVLNGYALDSKKVILKTSLTEKLGAKPGQSVKVINVTAEGDRYEVAEGKVADPVVRSGAFVVVSQEDAASISIGDEVRIDHSCSFMGCDMDGSLGKMGLSFK